MRLEIVKLRVVKGKNRALMRVGFPVIWTSLSAQRADATHTRTRQASHNMTGRTKQYDWSYGESSCL